MRYRYFYQNTRSGSVRVYVWFVRMHKQTKEYLGVLEFGNNEMGVFELFRASIQSPMHEFIPIPMRLEKDSIDPLMVVETNQST